MIAYRSALILATCISVAACNNSDPKNQTAAAVSSPAEMPSMGSASGTKDAVSRRGKGTGTVTNVDAAGGKITLDHDPIPEVGWPAMKMTFKAAPAVTTSAAVGDEVAFDVRVAGSESEVTAITKK